MYRQTAMINSASAMLNWITSLSINVPWPNSSLRISLSKTGFAPSDMKSDRFGGANRLSGN